LPREYVVARTSEIPEGSHRIVRVGRREIGVFNMGGVWHAIPNLCPHQRGPLCEGAISGTLGYGPDTDWKLDWVHEGEIVTCPWHALEWHVPSGRCLAFPDIRLRKFPTRVDGAEVRVIL